MRKLLERRGSADRDALALQPRDQTVEIADLDLRIDFVKDEEILTEISSKGFHSERRD